MRGNLSAENKFIFLTTSRQQPTSTILASKMKSVKEQVEEVEIIQPQGSLLMCAQIPYTH
jgi:hypothetical protein